MEKLIKSKNFIYILSIILSGYFYFIFNPIPRALWVPDETRYALVAEEMAVRGDFILPHYNGEI